MKKKKDAEILARRKLLKLTAYSAAMVVSTVAVKSYGAQASVPCGINPFRPECDDTWMPPCGMDPFC